MRNFTKNALPKNFSLSGKNKKKEGSVPKMYLNLIIVKIKEVIIVLWFSNKDFPPPPPHLICLQMPLGSQPLVCYKARGKITLSNDILTKNILQYFDQKRVSKLKTDIYNKKFQEKVFYVNFQIYRVQEISAALSSVSRD